MNRILLLTLALSLAPVLCWTAEPKAEEAKAIVEIEKLGGKVTLDEKSPGKPVIGVTLWSAKVTDAMLEHLQGLTKLQSLDLWATDVGDTGLAYLKGLSQLQSLCLWKTKVTNVGLIHLKGLTKLKSLVLLSDKVTDAGLATLGGLSQLESLHLEVKDATDAGLEELKGLKHLKELKLCGDNKITDKALGKLRQALPNCTIERKEPMFWGM